MAGTFDRDPRSPSNEAKRRLEELGRFLRDRRARIAPADAGLPPTARRRVRGLRREEVASLAGIGVSWYTALENGTAERVSESTLRAISDVLRLSESERHYVTALAGEAGDIEDESPGTLALEALQAITVPAYIINAGWTILACNDAFRRLWAIAADELPCNAIERLFMHPQARAMHADHFVANVTPVVAMLRSAVGRRPSFEPLRALRDRLLADATIEALWSAYEISSPFTSTSSTIESPLGTFCYRTLDLHIAGAPYGIVMQLPEHPVSP